MYRSSCPPEVARMYIFDGVESGRMMLVGIFVAFGCKIIPHIVDLVLEADCRCGAGPARVPPTA